jgi:translation initiation factor 1
LDYERLAPLIRCANAHKGENDRAAADSEHAIAPTISLFFATSHFAMKSRSTSGGLVYSTDSGRMCPVCRQPTASCICHAVKPKPSSDGVVRISRETKGRAGKGVTLVKGLALEPLALMTLGKQLKTACGSGGTVKDGVIEVQGDHCERVIEMLKAQGFVVKRAGG